MYSVAAHPRVNEAGHATWDRVWKSELAYWLELGSMSSMLLQCHPIHQSKDVDCRAKVGGWVEHAAERSVELETAERCAGREDAPRPDRADAKHKASQLLLRLARHLSLGCQHER